MKKILLTMAAIIAAVPAMAGIGSNSAPKIPNMEALIKDASKFEIPTKKEQRPAMTAMDRTEYNSHLQHISAVNSKVRQKNVKGDIKSMLPSIEGTAAKAGVRAALKDPEAPSKNGQWTLPFYAYDGMRLRKYDSYIGTDENNATLQGGKTYFYDAEGNNTGYEEIGADDIDNHGKVTLYKEYVENTANSTVQQVYLQDKNGEWYLYSDYSYTYYGERAVVGVNRQWDIETESLITVRDVNSQFDANDRPVSTITRSYDYTTKQLVNDMRCDYSYDAEGIPTITIYYIDYETKDWKPNMRETFYEYPNKNAILYGYAYWIDATQSWSGSYMNYTEFDDNNDVISSIDFSYDEPTQTWYYSTKTDYTYNVNGFILTISDYKWNTSKQSWEKSSDSGYEYRGDTLEIADWHVSYFNMDGADTGGNTTTAMGDRYEYDFDNFGRQISYSHFTLESANPLTWKGLSKSEYEFDDKTGNDRNYNVETTYNWDSSASDWVYNRRFTNKYDDHQRQTLNMSESYQDGKWNVLSLNKSEYIYDETGYGYEIYSEYQSYGSGSKTEYKYDSKFRTILEESYELVDGTWYLNSLYENQYDKDDNVILQVAGMLTGEEWMLIKIVMDWNDSGNYAMELYSGTGKDPSNITWYLTNYSRATYDSKGRISKYESKSGYLDVDEDGKEFVNWYEGDRHEYEYDSNDSVIVSQTYWYNFEEDEFTIESRNEFEYGMSPQGPCMIGSKSYSINYATGELELISQMTRTYTETTGHEETLGWLDGYDEMTVIATKDITYDFDGPQTCRVDENTWEEWMECFVKSRYEFRGLAGGQREDWYLWNSSEEKWVPTVREVRMLGTGGMTIKESYMYNETSESYVGTSKENFMYDEFGYCSFKETFEWNSDNNDWFRTSYSETKYVETATDVLPTLDKYEYWDSYDNEWVGRYFYEYGYDEFGNNCMYASYEWDRENNQWAGSYKSITMRDSLEHITLSATYQGWEDGIWIGFSQSEYAYDEQGHTTMAAYYDWDTEHKDFIGVDKSEYAYDEYGSTIMNASYEWDSEDWCWVGISKSVNIYEGERIVRENFTWSKALKNWVGDSRTVRMVVEEDFAETTVTLQYEWADGKWEYDTRYSYVTKYSSNYNTEFTKSLYEQYDAATKTWNGMMYQADMYRYTNDTEVKGLAFLSADIKAADGMISVAAEGYQISVASLGGAVLADAADKVSVAVPAGIYVITINGASTKVVVK